MVKKRYRIHPAIAVAYTLTLGAIAVASKFSPYYTVEEVHFIQYAVIALISLMTGVKLRHKIPLT